MLNFGKEWTPDELHVRDAYQFELKSDLFVDQESKKREFTQDFYLFIPQALQINTNTYSKDEFYRDQTFLFEKKHLNSLWNNSPTLLTHPHLLLQYVMGTTPYQH